MFGLALLFLCRDLRVLVQLCAYCASTFQYEGVPQHQVHDSRQQGLCNVMYRAGVSVVCKQDLYLCICCLYNNSSEFTWGVPGVAGAS